MRRRQFLASTALLGVTGLAGCTLDQLTGPQTPIAPNRVTEWGFEVKKTGGDTEGIPNTSELPNVQCLPEANTVEISGITEAGGPCDELLPETIAMDGDTFQFTVGVYDDEPRSGCADVLYIRAYEARFEFRDSLPSRVVALERWEPRGSGPRRTFTTCP